MDLNSLFNLNTFIELLLGISLSAAAGFRVFVPLLALSVASVFGHFDLPTDFDWLETPQAVIVFAVACSLEITGYYIPWLDHLLDIVATPAAFITGTIVTASVAPEMNPLVQWTLALVAGGGTAGLTKGLMNTLRISSTGVSGGLTNPIVSTIELVMAIGLSLLALVFPVLAGVTVIGFLIIAIQRIWNFFLNKPSSQTNETVSPSRELG
ncbi:DUF4126 domain-containing protein [Nostoc sp. 'Lobaria pulmonaria (5183) cyanobiont']|uniref:DUF4126 domain-containing protein n=1 Tax=Nostoc sp. 'Lobaria pulmonaria (5183) cyanobiont' TaxID=1618022 RepID=UPI000CF34168|nr:DUF4126 domain-containing protein [Nostoc sp. 'Lobaria pulmonaria (5183) cyanobiont']AVH71243.1 protein of unknown function DUF4126 [Nostoc sp. 'Lobaria pulmonaria (5183) cyanobiont']